MHIKNTVMAAIYAFATISAPTLVHGLDLAFLDQAPIRFFNDADLKLLSDSADKALDSAKDGETVAWNNEKTGNSGTLTPTRSFTRDGRDCRQLEVVNLAKEATRGSATSRMDFCKIDGVWKILSVVD
jgi:surface antigen